MNHNFKYFKKNLLLFLFPLLIPILILGTLSTIITKNYVEKEIKGNSITLLQQAKDNIELIFDEMNSLYLTLGNNPEIIVNLKKIFTNPHSLITLEELRFLSTINTFIDSSANARPYIQSIYVYFHNDQHRFLASRNGLVRLEQFSDKSWYHSYIPNQKSMFRTELRSIQPYPLAKSKVNVLTIYRNLNSPGFNKNMGVIVLNIHLNYIEDLLRNLKTVPEKSTLIMDDEANIIFKNGSLRSIENAMLIKLLDKPNRYFEFKLAKENYVAIQLLSKKYHWRYYFIIPSRVFYNIPNKLRQITTFLLLCSFSLSLILTYWLTRKNYDRVKNIISIIDSAKNGHPLPQLPSSIKDEYTYISYNLLKTFVEQNYLKVQLSERMYRLRFMELLALQSQINPHFLFNTLDTIRWKFIQHTKKQTDASKMLEELSDILKYSLKSPESKEFLAEELMNTRNYIEIQKIRYKDQFEVIWQYDESILDYPVIRLILQPLIENAIYHGIKPLDKKCYIKLKIRNQGAFLKINVIDNGLGMKREKLEEIRNHLMNDQNCGDNIGLYNTNKRLILTYGENAAIHIWSKFGFGTVIYFQIPLA